MINLLNEKLLLWISKNRITFIIILLSLGNIYQFIYNNQERKELRQELREVHEKLENSNKTSLSYERDRSNTLEKLLQDMLRMYSKVDERKDTIIDNLSKNKNKK